MSKYKTWWYWLWKQLSNVIGSINWTWLKAKFSKSGKGYDLTPEDHEQLKTLLAGGYYMILTNRKSHLSTYAISILTLLKTGKWPKYTHILMNLDLEDNPENFEKFKLMEATREGVHYSTFMDVFDCDSVCVMRPVNLKPEDWESIMEGLAMQLGKEYDNLFDIQDTSHVSCVEMVLDSLKNNPDYLNDFPHLEAMIQKVNNLTPQMYRDCEDFEVVMEVIR